MPAFWAAAVSLSFGGGVVCDVRRGLSWCVVVGRSGVRRCRLSMSMLLTCLVIIVVAGGWRRFVDSGAVRGYWRRLLDGGGVSWLGCSL